MAILKAGGSVSLALVLIQGARPFVGLHFGHRFCPA
jgi:hypothetical protein